MLSLGIKSLFPVLLVSLAAGCPVEAPSPAPPLARGQQTATRAASKKSGIATKPRPADRSRTWPSLPVTTNAANELVAALTLTPPPSKPEPELSVEQVRTLLLQRVKQGRVVAGWPAIVRWFQGELDRAAAAGQGAHILWGVYHDSGGQVLAFRRLVGQSGLRSLHAVVVEQLAADGQWKGVPASLQRGDSTDLTRYLEQGDRAAWRRLRGRQHSTDYTAWKYGYLPQVMDLLTSARAGARRLLPCDMPPQLKERVKKLPVEVRLRLRELHCGLAVTRALHLAGVVQPHRVAMLWGQGHVQPAGVPRFLSAGTRVISVRVYGHRPGPHGLEHRLGKKLILTHPLLIPLDARSSRLVLLLPGPALGGRLERTRDTRAQPVPAADHGRLVLRTTSSGVLLLTARSYRVPAAGSHHGQREVRLTPGDHAYLFTSAGRLMAGALQIPPAARAELDLDPPRREAHFTVFLHPPAPSGPGK